MHVSGMVAASHFARAAAWLTQLTSSFRTLPVTPFESSDPRAHPHTSHSARSAPAVFTILHRPTPHTHSLRTTSYLHASRLPFKHAFTFASAHAPESLHNCAQSSRDAHLASSSLQYTQTAMFPAPLRSALRASRAPCSAHGSDHINQQNRRTSDGGYNQYLDARVTTRIRA